MASRQNRKQPVVQSSGNVFTDLRLPRAEEKQTKSRLAVAINRIIADQRLSQEAASRRLKINQPKVSALSNYRLEGFSVERLMNFLTALDQEVDIVIRPKSASGRVARGVLAKGLRDELQRERGVWVFRLGKTLTEAETRVALRSIHAQRRLRNLGEQR